MSMDKLSKEEISKASPSPSPSPSPVILTDLNNDTYLEIIVTNEGSNTLTVLLGYQNTTFTEHTRYPTGSGPSASAVGDFNDDTKADIAVTNLGSNTVGVFLQDITQGFNNGITFASNSGSSLRSLSLRELNNDSIADIIVGNYGTDNIGVLLGKGTGTFEETVMYLIGFHPHAACVGDFNGDTYLDIAVANQLGQSVSLLLGKGDGSFVLQRSQGDQLVMPPSIVVSGDLNDDQRAEIIVMQIGSADISILSAYGICSFTYETAIFTCMTRSVYC